MAPPNWPQFKAKRCLRNPGRFTIRVGLQKGSDRAIPFGDAPQRHFIGEAIDREHTVSMMESPSTAMKTCSPWLTALRVEWASGTLGSS